MAITEETVLSFVRSSIKSAWTLELLLLLRRDRDRAWKLKSIVRELRGSVALVAESLAVLSEIGLIVLNENENYLYQPRSLELDELVSALVDFYAMKPITVLRTIFGSPSDRIRSFSDAFLLKRSDKT